MIHPNMATMLCITTDVLIKKKLLTTDDKEVIDDSFNMISVDGDTSTNDTAIVLANGKAENKIIDNKNESYETFKRALGHVCTELAKMMQVTAKAVQPLLRQQFAMPRQEMMQEHLLNLLLHHHLQRLLYLAMTLTGEESLQPWDTQVLILILRL